MIDAGQVYCMPTYAFTLHKSDLVQSPYAIIAHKVAETGEHSTISCCAQRNERSTSGRDFAACVELIG